MIAFGTLGKLNLNQDVQIRTASDAIKKKVQLWLNKKERQVSVDIFFLCSFGFRLSKNYSKQHVNVMFFLSNAVMHFD